MRKTFSAIEHINWNTEEYGYHTLKVKANQHCNVLDKELFSIDLLKMFYRTEGLLALSFHVYKSYHEEEHENNMFYLPEQVPTYQYHFNDIELDESALSFAHLSAYSSDTMLEDYLGNFTHYLSAIDQTRVLKWFLEQANTFNAEYTIDNNQRHFQVVLTHAFLDYCVKQACGENYSFIRKQIMEECLPNREETSLKKRKI